MQATRENCGVQLCQGGSLAKTQQSFRKKYFIHLVFILLFCSRTVNIKYALTSEQFISRERREQ